jgi:hypothetical protein
MASHKGGKCLGCGLRVTAGNIRKFEFDHHVQLYSQNDKTGRWGGDVRTWPPFTDKWFTWAAGVDLVCPRCHRERHRHNGKQRDLFSQHADVQIRLEQAVLGPDLTEQTELCFEEAAE